MPPIEFGAHRLMRTSEERGISGRGIPCIGYGAHLLMRSSKGEGNIRKEEIMPRIGFGAHLLKRSSKGMGMSATNVSYWILCPPVEEILKGDGNIRKKCLALAFVPTC